MRLQCPKILKHAMDLVQVFVLQRAQTDAKTGAKAVKTVAKMVVPQHVERVVDEDVKAVANKLASRTA